MTQYTIHTADETITAEHVQSDPSDINNRTRGDTATFNFFVEESAGTLTVDSGDTYTVASGTTEEYSGVTVNGTLVVDGILNIFGELNNNGQVQSTGTINTLDGSAGGFLDLLKYDRHAGSYTLSGTLNNTQRYKERLPSSPNISSLVVGLEPSNDLQDGNIVGKWGLISNVTDNRTRPLTNPVLTLEIDILADFSEYNDVSAVQTALEI